MKKSVIDTLCKEINHVQGITYPDKGFFQYANIAGDGRNWRTVYIVTGNHGGLTAVHNAKSPRRTANNLRAVLNELLSKAVS